MPKKDDMSRPGLGNKTKSTWPKISKADAALDPIQRLKPNSDLQWGTLLAGCGA